MIFNCRSNKPALTFQLKDVDQEATLIQCTVIGYNSPCDLQQPIIMLDKII